MPMNYFRTMSGKCGRNVRRALLTVAVAFASFASFIASADNTHLIIHFKDGSKTSFVLADKPSVSFVDNNVRVRAQHVDTDFDASTVVKFSFGDETSSVGKVEADEIRFTIPDADHVMAEGLKAGESVTVVSVEGRIVKAVRADAAGNARIELTGLASGVYVIATESGKNIKIKH